MLGSKVSQTLWPQSVNSCISQGGKLCEEVAKGNFFSSAAAKPVCVNTRSPGLTSLKWGKCSSLRILASRLIVVFDLDYVDVWAQPEAWQFWPRFGEHGKDCISLATLFRGRCRANSLGSGWREQEDWLRSGEHRECWFPPPLPAITHVNHVNCFPLSLPVTDCWFSWSPCGTQRTFSHCSAALQISPTGLVGHKLVRFFPLFLILFLPFWSVSDKGQGIGGWPRDTFRFPTLHLHMAHCVLSSHYLCTC